jgi:hypothetical protein
MLSSFDCCFNLNCQPAARFAFIGWELEAPAPPEKQEHLRCIGQVCMEYATLRHFVNNINFG